MIKNIILAVMMSWVNLSGLYASDTTLSKDDRIEKILNKYGAGFANLEHRKMGNLIKIKLYMPSGDPQRPMLHMPNGLSLSYGDIVMFAGDFFGEPSSPVSSCSPAEQKNCFKAQFERLAVDGARDSKQCSNPFVTVRQINDYFEYLQNEVDAEKSKGIPDWEYYETHANQLSQSLNRLTCGGSIFSAYLPFGQFIKLAQVNFDHFLPDAKTAYIAGHQTALDTAIKAHQKMLEKKHVQAESLLERAYAENAFANHFLSDAFSAGHIRTPRRVIHDKVHLPAVLNLLIANLMHDEDNVHGLNLVNAEGMSWKAYGDNYLFKEASDLQRLIMVEAMQRSADAVYQSFISGEIPSTFSELNLMPDPVKSEALQQTAPLFKVEEGRLLKRKKNHDPESYEWTSQWSGLITLLEFKL